MPYIPNLSNKLLFAHAHSKKTGEQVGLYCATFSYSPVDSANDLLKRTFLHCGNVFIIVDYFPFKADANKVIELMGETTDSAIVNLSTKRPDYYIKTLPFVEKLKSDLTQISTDLSSDKSTDK